MEATVYVGNLSYKREERGIERLFSQYGKVNSVKLMRDAKTDRSQGYAFVIMKKDVHALKAIKKLNGTIIDGRTLKVSMAQENESFSKKPTSAKIEDEKDSTVKKKKSRRDLTHKKEGLHVLFKHLDK